MRIGYNPHKDQVLEKSEFTHQVIMPVYIPNQDGYFKDSLSILKLSLESLFKTAHNRTFFSIVNNGSCDAVVDYLEYLYKKGSIQELIHTTNIGKLNAILKGLVGNTIELVTITDADVLFASGWQLETAKVFKTFPKVGVVGIVPQFNMFKSHCGNVIYDNLFNKNFKFLPIKSPKALALFYKSIGWDETYNKDFLKYGLGIENKEVNVLLGSGHFVATYKKQQFETVKSYLGYKLGGNTEGYLDSAALEFDYWRVTTQENYAFHMGNVLEEWMSEATINNSDKDVVISGFSDRQKMNSISYFIKNKLFYKLVLNKRFSKLFYSWKKLPKQMISNYNSVKAE
ncbi:glycosyltransferase family A protein [Algibacter lectus]|uniref:Glycosyl transferase family 2 n=1 Tax=Algibacter lectus TaxID=221126 RepID=A0A4R8MFP8_9FLAO|nr:glycosyltransferase family A protein [Algibacter lectus]MWW24830.1 glycosyltransferase [Algibacter lectus]TDY64759.1 glycosyl transferase family 2 [Algibacter lectus]